MRTVGAGRYAPSPSGQLHVGNLRTAMLAWLFARSSEKRFLLRIDDLDRDRDAGAATAQLDDLLLLGIDWDGAVLRQQSRVWAYEAAINRLAADGLVYECYCTRSEIHAAPRAPHAPPGAYPGTCRDLHPARRRRLRQRIAPRLPALRLRAPTALIEDSFDDLLLGRVTAAIDDIVLRRGDGTIAYHLATVVDDASMGVDQVVRGEDLASSTPRQLLLQRLLGLRSPEYAHVPLVLAASGTRLAKRDGAVTLASLAAHGINAAAVRCALAVSLGLACEGESVTMQQLLRRFDPQAVPRQPWIMRSLS